MNRLAQALLALARIRLRPLLLLLVGLIAADCLSADVSVYANGFESGSLCGSWSSVATPELCNGADDDCDGYIDELLVDCNVCVPPAAVEDALEGVAFSFCIPEQNVGQGLVAVAVCGESQCDGAPGCQVSGEIVAATVNGETGEIAMTVTVADALFDVVVTITTPPVEGGCDLAVTNITADVTVIFTTIPVATGVEEISAITNVVASTTFDLAVQGCGTQLLEDALNAILGLVGEALGDAFDEQLSTALETILAERLVGIPLCTG